MSLKRPEPVKDAGMDVPEAIGSAQAINFRPTGDGKAAITGDFVLAASGVNPGRSRSGWPAPPRLPLL